MPSLWNRSRRSIYRHKRILILLCTFGISFVAFNYSLLSSSPSVIQSQIPFIARNTDEDTTNRRVEKYEELVLLKRAQPAFPEIAPVASDQSVQLALSSSMEKDKLSLKVSENENVPFSSYTSSKQITHQTNMIDTKENFLKFISASHDKAKSQASSAPRQRIKRPLFIYGIKETSKKTRGNKNKNKNIEKMTVDNARTGVNISGESQQIITNTITNWYGNNDSRARKTDDKSEEIISPSAQESFRESKKKRGTWKGSILLSAANISPIHHLYKLPSSFGSTARSESLPPPSLLDKSNNSSWSGNSNRNNNNLFISSPTSISASTSTAYNNYDSDVAARSSFHIPACNTPIHLRRVQKRKKNLTVIENFIMGRKRVKCNETITYTTHGDYRYLDNLVPLVDRWNGPVSVAIYAPGSDLEESLKIISYLKMCTSSKINEWVTFHLIYDVKHTKRPSVNYGKPGDIPWLDELYQAGKWTDCRVKPTLSKDTFRIQNGLLYPINIARNIARSAANLTYFVLASDIELYPSINLIPSFMEMLRKLQKDEEDEKAEKINFTKNSFTAGAAAVVAKIFFPGTTTTSGITNETTTSGLEVEIKHLQRQHISRHVFVLPVFEVKKDVLPCQVETKRQLTALLKNKSAVLFHHSICPQCHKFPKYEDWKHVVYFDVMGKNNSCGNKGSTKLPTVAPLKVWSKAKRKNPHQLWEPIFIGTKNEPIYDERLSWEGLRDKMVMGYVMCALNYDFLVLDNAFLVHKPGIRRLIHVVTKTVVNQDRLINVRIRSELQKKFGKHDECVL